MIGAFGTPSYPGIYRSQKFATALVRPLSLPV
jgi:hypothetical protein